MCGIAGWYSRKGNIFNTQVADKLTDELFTGISNRGRDACGFVAIGEEGTLQWQKAAVTASMFKAARRPIPDGTLACLIHTRYSTQGHEGFMENNHPIKRGPFYVVHNGHVHNDEDVFKIAERDRFGGCDSEAIVALMAHYGTLDSAPLVMAELEGGAACAFLDERNPRELTIARGADSPLHMLEMDNIVIFASTEYAVRDAAVNAFKIDKDEGKKLAVRPFNEGTVAHWREGTLTLSGFEPKRWERPKWNGNTWDPRNTQQQGNGAQNNKGFARSDAGEACTVPDDGRPESSREVARTTLPARTGAQFVCELCEHDYGKARKKYEDIGGDEWWLCDDCYRWAVDIASPGDLETVADMTHGDFETWMGLGEDEEEEEKQDVHPQRTKRRGRRARRS